MTFNMGICKKYQTQDKNHQTCSLDTTQYKPHDYQQEYCKYKKNQQEPVGNMIVHLSNIMNQEEKNGIDGQEDREKG